MLTTQLRDWIARTARGAAWAPGLVFLVHAVLSRGFHAYDRFPPLDIPMHFLGGVVIAYFFHHAALNAATAGLTGPTDRRTHVVLVFALVATATVFWEFAEYLCDRGFGTHAQVDLEDTLLDMLLGILGGLTFLIGDAWFGRARRAAPGDA